jgi:hypothetical protein
MTRSLIAAMLAAGLATGAGAANLTAVFNNTSGAARSDPLRVQLEGETSDIPISFNGPRWVNGRTLPLAVYISQGPRTYTLRLEADPSLGAGGCLGQRSLVRARVLDMPGVAGAEHSVCVNESISRFLPGRAVFGWQNVMLALADNPQYDPNGQGESRLPFRFGLSAWTSNSAPWRDGMVRAPEGVEPFRGDAAAAGQLRVLQGHAAWGGGVVPRLHHAHVAHFYNDSPHLLLVTRASRDALSTFDFTQFVPPYSAVPFAMSWVPQAQGPDGSALHIFTLAPPPAQGSMPPPPGMFEPITSTGGDVLLPSARSVDELMARANRNTPSATDLLLGRSAVSELFSSRFEQYLRSTHTFRLATDPSGVRVWRCAVQGGCSPIGQPLPATDGAFPRYYRLVARGDSRSDISVQLTPVPDSDINPTR